MNAVFGANSFLGNNFINFFEINKIPYISLGENKPLIEKNNFILTDYSYKSLNNLDSFNISNVFIFKSLVRRDVDSEEDYEKINVHLFNRIIDYISRNHTVENIHYFSTKKEANNDINELYFKTKNYQDRKIDDYFSKKNNLVFKHFLPRIVGPRDLNFSRLTPQYISYKLFNSDFEINNPYSSIDFLTIRKFLKIFFKNKYVESRNIHYETSHNITIKDYLQSIDNYLVSRNKELKKEDINYLSFIDWYIDNQALFKKSYENWNRTK